MAVVAISLLLGSKPSAAVTLTTRLIASGFETPLFLVSPPGDPSRMFVVEQDARIWILRDGIRLPTPFLDIDLKVRTGGEQGLLGLAFHPNYEENGFFYVNYTRNPDGATVIERYNASADADVAQPESAVILLIVSQPFANHNGGMLAFGPSDGYLYIGMGDGGWRDDPGGRAQNLNDLLGKLLRIDVNSAAPYAIPPDNPFVGRADARPEIWAYGVRNPWRFAFDRANGDLYVGDVGQDAREEVDFQPASSAGGENYGWDIAEGFACLGGTGACGTMPGLTPPIHDYSHPGGASRSVTGGYVYRGSRIPGLGGTYFFADFMTGEIWSFRYLGDAVTDFQDRTHELDPAGELSIQNVSSFGEDASGELYILDYTGGRIFQIAPSIGDLNGDGTADAVDVQLVINGALGLAIGEADADIDGDTDIDAVDVQLVINAALGIL
ncbi:MAG: PQQ-dependent sugar dehydrogenase [Candidatus Hydrogenedentes bacterium]|nr:PQQ-dependent sugar dehydrogenase [Candidatus Hydrogenedentota bacterium]